jgi:hypothetical protein
MSKMNRYDIKKGLQQNGTFSIHKYVFESMYYMMNKYSDSPSALAWMTFTKAKTLLKEHGTFRVTPKLVGIDDPFVTLDDAAKMVIFNIFMNFAQGNRSEIPYTIEHSITKEKYKFVYKYFLDWFDNIDEKIVKELLEDEIICKSALCYENMHMRCLLSEYTDI